jgi:hypothetical protein
VATDGDPVAGFAVAAVAVVEAFVEGHVDLPGASLMEEGGW